MLMLLPFLAKSQNTLHYDTSTLIHGNGIAFLIDAYRVSHGFATFRKNNFEGLFYTVDSTNRYAFTGQLKCDSSCIEYLPGVKVKYLPKGTVDTIVMTIDSALYRDIFEYSDAKIISTEAALAPQMMTNTYSELDFKFDNPAVVPVGKWQKIDLINKYIFTDIIFDECGSTISIRYYNPDGSLLNERTLPLTRKKKK